MKCPFCKSRNTTKFGASVNKCYECDTLFNSDGIEITESVFSNSGSSATAFHFFIGIAFIIIMLIMFALGIFYQLHRLEKRIINVGYIKSHEYEILHAQYPRMTTGLYKIIKQAESDFSVPSYITASIIQGESEFSRYAVSVSGAKSYMQLMDGTAAELGVPDSFDPEQNIRGGVRFYKYCLTRASGNYALALKIYNAGPNRITFPKVSEDYSASCMNRISESENIKTRMIQI